MSNFPHQETITSHVAPLNEITEKWKVQLIFSSREITNAISSMV